MIFGILSRKQINSYSELVLKELNSNIETTKGVSNLIFDGIMKMDVKISKRNNILGGSYIELIDFIKNKKCCVNIKNNDDKCFFHVSYCI